MGTLFSDGRPTNSLISRIYIRLILVFSFVGAEFYGLYFFKNGVARFASEFTIRTYLDEYGPRQFWLATHSPIFFIIGFYALLIIIIIRGTNELRRPHFLKAIFKFQISYQTKALNVISFSALLVALILISDPKPLISNPYSLLALFYTASPLLWLIYFWSILGFLFPLKALSSWVFHNLGLTFFILVATALTISDNENLVKWTVNFWSSLLLKPTLNIALALSRSFGLATQLFPGGIQGPIFGTNQFQVEMWAACSGYEGMGLIILLLSTYCYLQRDHLRIFRTILVIPLAVIAMFFLNAVRIVILIAIGHFYSPKLALDGFHIVGGWINLLIVVVLSLYALNASSYFLKNSQLPVPMVWSDAEFLSPLVAIIVGGILSGIFVTDFAWLYPFQMSIAALVIFYFRKSLRPIVIWPSHVTYIVGVIVFLLWIFLVPIDRTQNQHFFQQIEGAPLGVALLWLICRLIGAAIIVPIAEELAFRGFLLRKMQTWLDNFFTRGSLFQISPSLISFISMILSLISTSLLFGVLHSDILAGSLAGLGFGMVYFYRRKLIDAIVAHAITNTLLAVDVIYFGNWSYW